VWVKGKIETKTSVELSQLAELATELIGDSDEVEGIEDISKFSTATMI